MVKHALAELVTDATPADDVLNITVCEPAMGSAAFLNEAVNQLAEKYLERKQRELNRRIDHADYADELQRARHRIADRNVFGVDLNPVALELAEVSLWLNGIHQDGHVPWFGYQLMCGNSLVGARRQVHPRSRLTRQKKADLWFNSAPRRVPWQTADGESPKRPPGTVYHFLLPDDGMANYRDKAAKRLEAAKLRAHQSVAQGVLPALPRGRDRGTGDALQPGRRAVGPARRTARPRPSANRGRLPVWGQPGTGAPRRTANEWKDRIRAQGVFSEGTRTVGPYRRLKLAMDYWCALWFWPIRDAASLPSRDEFLNEISLVLTGNVFAPGLGPNQTADLFGKEYAEHAGDLAKRIANEIGMLDLQKLFEEFPRLKFVDALAGQHRFHHWELAFADVFAANGGFDLVLGNPPWVKVEWEEGGVLGDRNPLFVLRRHSATEITALRGEMFERYDGLRDAWLRELAEAEATQGFLNARQNYPLLAGQQTNLYKCFLPQAWMIGRDGGVAGFLHPEGVYDDPKGGVFREALYSRLRAHFQFQNEKRLFSEVHHETLFSVNVYGEAQGEPKFKHVANLFAPATVDACLEHERAGRRARHQGRGGMDDGWPRGPRCGSGRGGAGELRHAVRRGGNATAPRPAAGACQDAAGCVGEAGGASAAVGGSRRRRILCAASLGRDDGATGRHDPARDALPQGRLGADLLRSALLRRQPVQQDAAGGVYAEQPLRCAGFDDVAGRLPAAHQLRCSLQPSGVRGANAEGELARGLARGPGQDDRPLPPR